MLLSFLCSFTVHETNLVSSTIVFQPGRKHDVIDLPITEYQLVIKKPEIKKCYEKKKRQPNKHFKFNIKQKIMQYFPNVSSKRLKNFFYTSSESFSKQNTNP